MGRKESNQTKSLTHSRGSGGVDADGVEGVGLTLLAKTSEEDHLSLSLEPRLPATSKDTDKPVHSTVWSVSLLFFLDTLT